MEKRFLFSFIGVCFALVVLLGFGFGGGNSLNIVNAAANKQVAGDPAAVPSPTISLSAGQCYVYFYGSSAFDNTNLLYYGIVSVGSPLSTIVYGAGGSGTADGTLPDTSGYSLPMGYDHTPVQWYWQWGGAAPAYTSGPIINNADGIDYMSKPITSAMLVRDGNFNVLQIYLLYTPNIYNMIFMYSNGNVIGEDPAAPFIFTYNKAGKLTVPPPPSGLSVFDTMSYNANIDWDGAIEQGGIYYITVYVTINSFLWVIVLVIALLAVAGVCFWVYFSRKSHRGGKDDDELYFKVFTAMKEQDDRVNKLVDERLTKEREEAEKKKAEEDKKDKDEMDDGFLRI